MSRPNKLVKSKEVVGINVTNLNHEELGKIEEIVIDKLSGKIAYVVLNSGSFLGLGGKLFALPWHAIKYDTSTDCFLLDLDKEELKEAPGFNKDEWPNMADSRFSQKITDFYGEKTYLD